MNGRLRTTRQGLDLIKSFEGFRPASARLPDGRWTIGYGHVRSAREGVVINEKDAEDLLRYDLRGIEEAVNELAFTPLTQNQFDALASLVFNISPGQFKDSSILHALNAGDYIAAAAGFDAWRKARINGRLIVVDALVRRRAVEKALFLEPDAGRPAAPTPLVTPELDKTYGFSGRDVAVVETRVNGADVAPSAAMSTPRKTEADDIASAIAALAGRGADPDQRELFDSRNLDEDDNAEPVATVMVQAEAVVVEAVEPPQPPTFDVVAEAAPETPDDAARVVAARLAKILARTEKLEQRVDEQGARNAPPRVEPTSQPKSVEVEAPEVKPEPVKAVVKAEPKEPPQPPSLEKASPKGPRIFIDDTEVYDPGRDPSELFAEIEAQESRANGARNGGPNFNWVELAPWLGIVALAVMGLVVGSVETISKVDAPGNAVQGPLVVVTVFGLLLAMGLYFIAARVFRSPEA